MTKQVGDTTKFVGGPDELRREYQRLMGMDEPDDYVLPKMFDLVLAAAAAWEADIVDWHVDCLRLGDEITALRQRLEAAEKREVNLRSGYQAMADVFNNVIAALAGEE
jgi:hypothetical protein